MQTDVHDHLISANQATAASLPPDPVPAVLLVPGLNNSGPGHWQSHWEELEGFRRVELGDWDRPRLHEWVPALDRAVRDSSQPVVFAAHSLGCLAVLWWASLFSTDATREKVKGALLVAPPDVDAVDAMAELRDFRPMPRAALPFPAVVVASGNDPFAPLHRSRAMARAWNCQFVDAGMAGHINADSRLGSWSSGLRLLAGLTGHTPSRQIAELALRTPLR